MASAASYRSIGQKDGTSVVGTIVCLVLIYLLVNLIVDILYGFLDRGSLMTDTSRDSALDTESVVPFTTGQPGSQKRH